MKVDSALPKCLQKVPSRELTYLGKRKIRFKSALVGDMLVPWEGNTSDDTPPTPFGETCYDFFRQPTFGGGIGMPTFSIEH